MTSVINIFRQDPHIEEITDAQEVKVKYNYWRFRILYSTFIGYAFYYFTRKSFIFAMPGMIEDLGFHKSDLGILASIFAITYGISKFASGVLSDRSNPRYFMAFGLMVTGVLNIFFGMCSSLYFFAIFWGLNGWFQGFGWPPCARLLTYWYSKSERGSWWSTWNVSHNVGSFLIPWIVGFCLYYFNWRVAMYVPGVLCILAGFFLINRLRDTPQSLGLPAVEKFRNDYSNQSLSDSENNLTAMQIFVQCILKNKYIWLLSVAYFFVYFVRAGVDGWTALYLIEAKGYSRIGANGCISLFEVGGFFGSLFAGWASDYIFAAKRGPVNVLFAGGMLISICLFWYVPAGYYYLDALALFALGFSIFGPQMLIGVAAAELSHKKAASTATGFAGCFSYMGAAVAGYPLAVIAQSMGWDGFFIAIATCCLISILILLPMWGVTERTVKIAQPIPTPAKSSTEYA